MLEKYGVQFKLCLVRPSGWTHMADVDGVSPLDGAEERFSVSETGDIILRMAERGPVSRI